MRDRARFALIGALAGLNACGPAGQSVAGRQSCQAQRDAFRQELGSLVHISQCPTTTPLALAGEEARLDAVRDRLVARIAASALRRDLDAARRADEEASRLVFESDCVGFRLSGERAVRDATRRLQQRAAELHVIEMRFDALAARCGI
ncbi:MAG: hypothetical protein QOJ53_2313 [Sphingomonadales bacterium]|jgi:hypothetical protein|nr:hypothetical protein [Sphingomonadales bacterium]